MDDALAVRGVERFGELQQDLEHARRGEAARRERLRAA